MGKLFLNAVSILTTILALLYVLTRSRKVTKELLKEKLELSTIICLGLFFTLAVILTSKFPMGVYGGAKSNFRTAIVMISCLFGTSGMGVAVGVIGAIYRYALGGWTALPCALATLLCGLTFPLVVNIFNIRVNKPNKKIYIVCAVYPLLLEVLHILVLVPTMGDKPFMEAFASMKTLVWAQVFVNVFAVLIFIYLFKDMIFHEQELGRIKEKIENKNEELMAKVSPVVKLLRDINKNIYNKTVNNESSLSLVSNSVEEITNGVVKQTKNLDDSLKSLETFNNKLKNLADESLNIKNLLENIEVFEQSGAETVKNLIDKTSKSKDSMKIVNDNIATLKNKIYDIDKTTNMIKAITEQTNLLSLNASIEAARAGEAGKGFAVVANEVKKLSSESEKSTELIAEIISSIENSTTITVTEIEKFEGILVEQNNSINETQEIFNTILSTIAEIKNIVYGFIEETNNLNKDKNGVAKTFESVASLFGESTAQMEEITCIVQKTLSDFNNFKELTQELNHNVDSLNTITKEETIGSQVDK